MTYHASACSFDNNYEMCMLKSKLQVLHKPPCIPYNHPNTRWLCLCQLCCDDSSRRLHMNWMLNHQFSLMLDPQMQWGYFSKHVGHEDAVIYMWRTDENKNVGREYDQHVLKLDKTQTWKWCMTYEHEAVITKGGFCNFTLPSLDHFSQNELRFEWKWNRIEDVRE